MTSSDISCENCLVARRRIHDVVSSKNSAKYFEPVERPRKNADVTMKMYDLTCNLTNGH